MNSAFNGQILAEKLSKLNSSQQSIETLSHWCIFHRKKARQVVETWDKQFRELPKERVPFLYLVNDILQNSRRRGGEYVTEFWRILPGALKDAMEKCDENGRNVVLRLVDIWEERKVFGSRAHSLREELLGKDPPPDLPENKVKSSHKIKIKVPVGGIQEKLASAYRSLHGVAAAEDATLGRCNAAAMRIENLGKEADSLNYRGDFQDATLADELQEQQNILSQCVEHLEMSEMARATIVSHLKEALREQESKLELIRAQLQIAQSQSTHAANLQRQLLNNSSPIIGKLIQHDMRENGSDTLTDNAMNDHLERQPTGDISRQPMPPLPVVENIAPMSNESNKPKSAASIAAEVAARLAASTSSAQMLTSALSSLAAEEAASLATTSVAIQMSVNDFHVEKRQRMIDQPENVYNADVSSSYAQLSPSPQLHLSGPLPQHVTTVQRQSSPVQHQQPLPPPLPPQHQFMPNNASMMGMSIFGFARGTLPQPPPQVQSHPLASMPFMTMPHLIVGPRPYQPLQQAGTSFFGLPPLPTPSVPRQ
eukprot:c28870_g1_i1 orf=314-1930(+)